MYKVIFKLTPVWGFEEVVTEKSSYAKNGFLEMLITKGDKDERGKKDIYADICDTCGYADSDGGVCYGQRQ